MITSSNFELLKPPLETEQVLGRRYSGEEVGALVRQAIDAGLVDMSAVEVSYSTEEVAAILGIDLKEDYGDREL